MRRNFEKSKSSFNTYNKCYNIIIIVYVIHNIIIMKYVNEISTQKYFCIKFYFTNFI